MATVNTQDELGVHLGSGEGGDGIRDGGYVFLQREVRGWPRRSTQFEVDYAVRLKVAEDGGRCVHDGRAVREEVVDVVAEEGEEADIVSARLID